MSVDTYMYRSTLAPGEVVVRLTNNGRALEAPLDEAVNLAMDILEAAYKIRSGQSVPVVVPRTGRAAESSRYRPAAQAYSVVQPRSMREVSVHLGRLQDVGKTGSWRNDNDVLVPDHVARVIGQQLITAARESAAGIYERAARACAS